MSATTQAPPEGPSRETPAGGRNLAHAAYRLLQGGFVVAPILFGIDKFFNWMVEWPIYLWSGVADVLPGSAQQIMYAVGVVEVAAGILVLLAPRIGGPVVATWLGVIVINLVLVGLLEAPAETVGRTAYWDIALRDVGLMMGAAAFSLLAFHEHRRPSSG